MAANYHGASQWFVWGSCPVRQKTVLKLNSHHCARCLDRGPERFPQSPLSANGPKNDFKKRAEREAKKTIGPKQIEIKWINTLIIQAGDHGRKIWKYTSQVNLRCEQWDVVPEVTVVNATDSPQALIHLVHQTWPQLAVDLGMRSCWGLPMEEASTQFWTFKQQGSKNGTSPPPVDELSW